MRRAVAALSSVCFLLLGTTSAATAAPSYPPAQPGNIAVTATTVPPGTTVGIRLVSWLPGEPIAVAISGPAAGADVSASGDSIVAGRAVPSAFRAAITVTCVPAGTCHPVADANGFGSGRVVLTRLGIYTLTADGTSMDGTSRTVSTQVRVVPEALVSGSGATAGGQGSASGNGLPKTGGANRTPLFLGLGAGLILAGAGVIAFARRRRTSGARHLST